MDIYCTRNRDTCPCRRHSNLRSFFSEGSTDARDNAHDNTGRKYAFLDPRTLASNHEKQEILTFGFSTRKQGEG